MHPTVQNIVESDEFKQTGRRIAASEDKQKIVPGEKDDKEP